MTVRSVGLSGLGRGVATQGTYGMVRTGKLTTPTVTSWLVQTPPSSDSVKLDTGEYTPQADFNALSPSEQAYLRKFGIDAFNREQAQVAERRVQAIEPFKSGEGYDLAKMVGTGYSKEKLVEYGFGEEDISEAQKYQSAVGKVQDYETLEGYDLVKAIEDNVDNDALVMMFGEDLVTDTRRIVAEYNNALGDLAPYKSDGGYNIGEAIEAVDDGKIPEKSLVILFGADEIVKTRAGMIMTAREQFDQWKSTDPSAPKDAVFEGESPEGGFQYSSPSSMTVEVETAKGKVTMLVSEWDSMSDMQKYETVLGRAPTSNEWQGYRLLEAGIDLAWWKELVPGAPDFVGRLAKFIPGEQVEERYVDVKQAAISEWVKAYPHLKGVSIVAGVLENLGFSAAKAIYPQVTVKDITGKEWAMTGLVIALWTLPKWLPKVTSAGKVLFNIKFTTKTPIVRLQAPYTKVNLGLLGTKVKWKFPVKFSWGAGLQRAGLSAKIERIAFNAGKAARELRAATSKAVTSKGVLLSPKVASRLKIAQMKSLSADTKFIESLSGLKVTAKQIQLLQKATGYKGLVNPIRNVGIATRALDLAWDTVSKTAKMYGMGSRNYIASLRGVTKARVSLGKALDKLNSVLRTRYAEAPLQSEFRGFVTKWQKRVLPTFEGGEPVVTSLGRGGKGVQLAVLEKTKPVMKFKTFSELKLTAKYTEQLLNQVKASGYPIFSAEKALAGLLPVMISQPLSVQQTTDVAHILGVSVKQVNALAKQGQLSEALAQRLTDLQMELVVMTDASAIAQVVPKVEGVTDVEVETLAQIALKVATDAMTKNMTAEQVKTATETAVQQEVKAATKLQVKTITKLAVKTATQLKTQLKTRLKTEFKIKVMPGVVTKGTGARKKRGKYPDGTIVWKMGELKRGEEWKIIPPPYTLRKPISDTKPPKGVKVTKGTPQETLCFLGGKTPFKNVAFDLGVVDGYIDVKSKQIVFTGEGMKTNVGKRIPSMTKGITLANSSMIRRLPRQVRPKRSDRRYNKPSQTVSIGGK